jgi:hypothetical protein
VLALPEVDEGGDHGDEEDGRDQVFGHGIDPFGAPRYAFTSEPYVWLINGMFHARYDGRSLCPVPRRRRPREFGGTRHVVRLG